MSNTLVHVGDVAPIGVEMDVTPSAALPDLSVVTSATIVVRTPAGTKQTWTAVISGQSPTGLHLSHPFASGDVDREGIYVAYAELVAPAGTIDTLRFEFTVAGEFA